MKQHADNKIAINQMIHRQTIRAAAYKAAAYIWVISGPSR